MQATTVKSYTRRPSVQAEIVRKSMHNKLAREIGRPEPYPDLDLEIPFPSLHGVNVKDVTIAFRDASVLAFFLAVCIVGLAVIA
jgi:hypothetical protein